MVSKSWLLAIGWLAAQVILAATPDGQVGQSTPPGGFRNASDTGLTSPTAKKPAVLLTPEMRGDIFMAEKRFREAAEMYLENSKGSAVMLNKTGIAYHQMLQLDSALKSYQQAIRLKKNYLEAINNIGTVYYARKNYRRSITYYQRALKLAPQDIRSAAIYNNMGTALFARKQYKEASEALQTALKLDPDVFEHTSAYGVMLEERSVQERAKYHYYLAKTYAKAGQGDRALQYIRKSIEEGFKERDKFEKEPEFAFLHENEEFKQLMTMEQKVL